MISTIEKIFTFGPLFLLLIIPAQAQNIRSFGTNTENLNTDRVKTFTSKDLEKIDSQKRGTVLKRRDFNTGLFLEDYNTNTDRARVSFIYHFNKDIADPTSLQSMEFIYAFQQNNYWYEFFGQRISARLEEFSEAGANSIGTNEVQLKDSILSFGGSLAMRGQWIQDLVNSKKMFTTTSAGIGYYSFSETSQVQTYNGPGLKLDFGFHRRSTPKFHYGAKMTYQIATVKREVAFEGETSSQRSLTLSWLTFGFDLSFYF